MLNFFLEEVLSPFPFKIDNGLNPLEVGACDGFYSDYNGLFFDNNCQYSYFMKEKIQMRQ